MSYIDAVVLNPRGPEPMSLTKEDVWGEKGRPPLAPHVPNGWPERPSLKNPRGRIVQNSIPRDEDHVCPIWGDILGPKDVTVVCHEDEADEVEYWLEHVHGGGCVVDYRDLPDGMVAMRSEYQCW